MIIRILIAIVVSVVFKQNLNAQSQAIDFTLSKNSITIAENNRPNIDTFEDVSVTLLSQPSSTVTITFNPTIFDQVTFTPAQLQFNSSNWDTPQIVRISAVDDGVEEQAITVIEVNVKSSITIHDSGSGDGSHDSGSGDGSHDSGTGDGSHDSGTGDGSHDSGSGDGSHDSGTGDGSHDSGSGDGSHDSGTGDGSHDSGTGDGSHDSGTGDGSHDSGTGDGSHDSGTGDGSHDSGSGDGSNDSGSNTHEITKQLTVNLYDFKTIPADISDINVNIGFNSVGYKLATGISDLNGDGISDIDVDSLNLVEVISPSNGTLSMTISGDIVYTPDDKYYGTETFSFRISDGSSKQTAITEVTINVIGLGDLNGDGVADTIDLTFLASNLVGVVGYEIPFTFENVFDINQDGTTDTIDLVHMASALVGVVGFEISIN